MKSVIQKHKIDLPYEQVDFFGVVQKPTRRFSWSVFILDVGERLLDSSHRS